MTPHSSPRYSPNLLRVGLGTALALLSACSTRTQAPVVDHSPVAPVAEVVLAPTEPKPADPGKVHLVVRGDTLIGIALQYGIDYRELAAWNNIENRNVIRLGDSLRITPPGAVGDQPGGPAKPTVPVATPLVTAAVPTPIPMPVPANTATMKTEPKGGKVPYSDQSLARLSAAAAATPAAVSVPATPLIDSATPVVASAEVDWAWPVKGTLIAGFTEARKGIDISGTKGTPVLAATSGKVTYAGNGIRGLGQLLVVRHSATWLSAYGHNDRLLVTEGQEVKKGQKIAEMGASDSDQVKLHFQIRKNGTPIDPSKLLPNQ